MVSYMRLMHLLTALSVTAAAYTGAVVAGSNFVPERSILLALISIFLIAGGCMAINDIAGHKLAYINPKKPIPSRKAGKAKVTAWAVLLLAAGNFITFYFFKREIFYITILSMALLLAHAKAKKLPAAGEILAGVLFVVAIFFGAFVHGSYIKAIPLMSLAFLSVMANGIYKTAGHTLSENHPTHSTIATKLGVVRTRILANIFIVATVIAGFAMFFMKLYSHVYLFFVVIASIIIVAASIAPLRLSPKLIKIAVIIIFLAFFADIYSASLQS